MESIGEKLRTAREQRGYSLEQVSRDTNISKRFLTALEEEDFKAFPGEPYLLGFLNNYSDYLGLSSAEMVNLYKNTMLQEQPIPIEELLVKKKNKFPIVALILVLLLAGVGGGLYLLYPHIGVWRERRAAEKAALNREREAEQNVFLLNEEVVERSFQEGQIISANVKGVDYTIKLRQIGETVVLEIGERIVELKGGDIQNLDLDGDADAELKIYIREIDRDNKTTVLRLDRFIQSTIPQSGSPSQGVVTLPGVSESPVISVPSVGSTNEASRRRNPQIIMESDTPKPFEISAVFRGYCLFRYLVDNQERDERYFHKGETFQLMDIQKEVRLWISNAGSFKPKIGGVDVDLGRPGEVVTTLVTWVKDEQTERYRLTLVPVY